MRSIVFILVLSSSAVSGLKTDFYNLEFIELALTSLLGLEMLYRFVKQGSRGFFSSGINIFDLVVTALSFFISAFAIFRLLSLVSGLRKITQMIVKSLPSIAYVSLLLAIHSYFYGIIGVSIFSENDPSHFGSLALALISLFQVITLEGWADLMNFEMQNFPIVAPLYFISFVIIGTILILNVLVSVMTNAFVEVTLDAEMSLLKKAQDANFEKIKGELRSINKTLKVPPKLELVVNKA